MGYKLLKNRMKKWEVNMKKVNVVFIVLLVLGLITISGCSKGKDLTEYLDVRFAGIDTRGTVSCNVDYERLLQDALNYNSATDFADEEMTKEIEAISNSYKIIIDKEENLTNADEIKIIANVNSEKTNKIKSGEKTIEVEGLEKPHELTTKAIEENLIVNFLGYSGRGVAQIDNTFSDGLSNIDFKIEKDGMLKNGDKATVEVSKDLSYELENEGYVVEKGFAPVFEVKGLDKVAKQATEISNIDDIKRMIDESINRKYKSAEQNQYFWDTQYEIHEEKMMYRQFNSPDDSNGRQDSYVNNDESGNLIKIFTVKSYSGGPEGKLEKTRTAILGYSNIALNDKKEANVAEITEIVDEKDDTYSLESVMKLYEGYGYSEAE